jgi:acetyltransferase-like isoleucine patch superfamily enzyme
VMCSIVRAENCSPPQASGPSSSRLCQTLQGSPKPFIQRGRQAAIPGNAWLDLQPFLESEAIDRISDALSRIAAVGCSAWVSEPAAYHLQEVEGFLFGCTDPGKAPKRYEHRGAGNVLLCEAGAAIPYMVRLYGTGNVVFIGREADLHSGVINVAADGGILCIGAGTRMAASANIRLLNGGSIVIGEACVLERHTIISNSDGHAIYDRNTGLRRNPDRDVRIGNGVMLEEGVRVNKGVTIGDGSIVGESSLVNGAVQPHCYYSGVPARLIEQDVYWSPAAR